MKTGIFGGTFNPIHSGHIHLARALLKALSLDRVLIIPTNLPPHKGAQELADGLHRLKMCRLAVKSEPQLQVSCLELDRPGSSYTADTLGELSRLYPQDRFYLLMGGDMFLTLESWQRAEEILRGATLCTAARDTGEYGELCAFAKKLEGRGAQTVVLSTPPLPISSTQIRGLVKEGGPLGELLPKRVEDYLLQNGLYGSDACAYPWPLETYRTMAERMETAKRMAHSVAVANQAVHLAELHGGPVPLARVAGLLHDICKCMPEGEQLQRILKSVIIWDTLILDLPSVWHGIAGSAYLEDELNLYNRQILDAIRYHTTGRANMTLLEKIVFLADLTSEDRTYGDVHKMRRLAENSLEDAMREALVYTCEFLTRSGVMLCRDTIAVCQEYGVLPRN